MRQQVNTAAKLEVVIFRKFHLWNCCGNVRWSSDSSGTITVPRVVLLNTWGVGWHSQLAAWNFKVRKWLTIDVKTHFQLTCNFQVTRFQLATWNFQVTTLLRKKRIVLGKLKNYWQCDNPHSFDFFLSWDRILNLWQLISVRFE